LRIPLIIFHIFNIGRSFVLFRFVLTASLRHRFVL
jgi:hypothetical protein